MASQGSDPTRIRSIAVHRDDVATALEATLRSDRDVVLRITPPFSGRMRARIHDVSSSERTGSTGDGSEDPPVEERGERPNPEPIHVDPASLVDPVPSYPEVDETAPASSDLDAHHARHSSAVATWRETVKSRVVDSVRLDADGVAHEVDVRSLG